MESHSCGRLLVILAVALLTAGCPAKTAVDYTIEARSFDDIAKDNGIVLDVNGIMASMGNIDASTEIWEQRLLVTGIFDNADTMAEFKRQVEAVEGIKQLYWHAFAFSKAEQKQKTDAGEMLNWGDTLILDSDVGIALIKAGDIADVNYRVAVDPFRTAYILGLARSDAEKQRALEDAREVPRVAKVVDYVVVRPKQSVSFEPQ